MFLNGGWTRLRRNWARQKWRVPGLRRFWGSKKFLYQWPGNCKVIWMNNARRQGIGLKLTIYLIERPANKIGVWMISDQRFNCAECNGYLDDEIVLWRNVRHFVFLVMMNEGTSHSAAGSVRVFEPGASLAIHGRWSSHGGCSAMPNAALTGPLQAQET